MTTSPTITALLTATALEAPGQSVIQRIRTSLPESIPGTSAWVAPCVEVANQLDTRAVDIDSF